MIATIIKQDHKKKKIKKIKVKMMERAPKAKIILSYQILNTINSGRIASGVCFESIPDVQKLFSVIMKNLMVQCKNIM